MIDGSRIKVTFEDEFELAIYYQLDDVACYSPDTNTIYLKQMLHEIDVIITHEFMHMLLNSLFGKEICHKFDNISTAMSL